MQESPITVLSHQPIVYDWLMFNIEQMGLAHSLRNESNELKKATIIDVAKFSDLRHIDTCEETSTACILFSHYSHTKFIKTLNEREVKGFIHLNTTLETFKSTIEAALEGESYFDEEVLTFILSNKYREIYESISSLSNREMEIIDGIMEDLTNNEIADRFGLSVRTVNAHKRNILQKLKSRSLVGVARMMLTYTMRYS